MVILCKTRPSYNIKLYMIGILLDRVGRQLDRLLHKYPHSPVSDWELFMG